jgi:hypothetical protein
MKPIRGLLFIVIQVHGFGYPGPDEVSGMPTGVHGCGRSIGWQPITVRAGSGKVCFYGWIFPTEAEAKRASEKSKRWHRRREKKEMAGKVR